MNAKTVLMSLLVACPLSVLASERHIAQCQQGNANCQLVASGRINLLQTRGYAKTKDIFFTINNDVNGVLRLYYSRTKNQNLIRGEFIVNNTDAKRADLRYRVVFKDKVGAVAQSKGNMMLARGKNQKVKFGSVVLMKEDIKNIHTYEIKMSNENPPGRLR